MFEQTAPIIFLWASRAAVAIGGAGEHSLRLLPTLAGLAFVPLVWYAARQLLGRTAALGAAALAAVCPNRPCI